VAVRRVHNIDKLGRRAMVRTHAGLKPGTELTHVQQGRRDGGWPESAAAST
jgi:hypothetical protein